MQTQRKLACGVAALVVVAAGWWCLRIPPASAPLQAATISSTAACSLWTIDGRPVVDGLILKEGSRVEVQAEVKLTDLKQESGKWTSRGPWNARVDELDVWIRFAQERPRSDREALANVQWLEKSRAKSNQGPRKGTGRVPKRLGEYELQLVVHKRKFMGFTVDHTREGEVIQVVRVQVVANR